MQVRDRWAKSHSNLNAGPGPRRWRGPRVSAPYLGRALSPLGLLEHILVVSADGAVTYDQEGDVTEVSDFKIEGGEFSFGINVQGYDVIFSGTLEGKELVGDLHMDGSPVATVVGEMGDA